MRKAKMGICTYCGRFRELTRDHVIATCLFPPPLPVDMITVDACEECNGRKKSRDDSFLRDFLCYDAWGNTHPTAQQLFKGKAMRSIERNSSELANMAVMMGRLKPFNSPSGIYLGDAIQFEIPNTRIEQIISTIVRGLYFDAREQRLPTNCQFYVDRHIFPWQFKTLKEVMDSLHMHGPRVLGDVFRCVYAIATGEPYLTMWILQLYNRVVFSVFTEMPKLIQPISSPL
jgi:hypothetical protein